MKKKLFIISGLVLLPFLYLSTVILIGTLAKYEPEEIEIISKIEEDFYLDKDAEYSVLIWNIGYAGLGAEMDFFYDGGKSVRDKENNVRRNIYKITQLLQDNDSVDFILLQEVDENSKRTYGINMADHFNLAMPEHFSFFALNYKVAYVPVPLFEPMGRVETGLMTFSKHIPSETVRHSLPGNYSWPKNVFMLERCFLSNRFRFKDGNDFVLINTHNSAHDDGSLRRGEMTYLKKFLDKEGLNSSRFVAGGDWNQNPPSFPLNLEGHFVDTASLFYIGDDFLREDWKFVYDSQKPTHRLAVMPYKKGKSPVSILDFFLTSESINVLSCETIDLEFANSDHQPVILNFKFK